jgi:hypothetical protein
MSEQTIYHNFLDKQVIVNYKNGRSAIGVLKQIQIINGEPIIYIKGDYKEFIIRHDEIADIKTGEAK